ncbi:MAG: rubrerythrin family protein [Candidatus Zixiibacteriota bacterium]|nr:MAG: rubrerythrin family protein [candidate division Zixibacteria bacterium]
MSTRENLMAAFEGECKAHFRYLAFAVIAEREGHHEVARLFRAVAEAEAIHALAHFDILGEAGDTEQNLMSAIDGETYEFTQMYPAFIEQSENEANTRATISFRNASEVEKIHNNLYSKALENLGKNRKSEYHVCEICGNTVAGNAPDKCPVCGASIDKFKIFKD